MVYIGQPSPTFSAPLAPVLEVLGPVRQLTAPTLSNRMPLPAPGGLAVAPVTMPPAPVPPPAGPRAANAPYSAWTPVKAGGGAAPEPHGYQANWWWVVAAAAGVGAVVLAATWTKKPKTRRNPGRGRPAPGHTPERAEQLARKREAEEERAWRRMKAARKRREKEAR